MSVNCRMLYSMLALCPPLEAPGELEPRAADPLGFVISQLRYIYLLWQLKCGDVEDDLAKRLAPALFDQR